MLFQLSEEQDFLIQSLRKFCQQEIAPLAEKVDQEKLFPHQNFSKMAQLGLLGLSIPEEQGGSGGDSFYYLAMIEEVARACASTSVIVAVHTGLACTSLSSFGTTEQQARYLPAMVEGEKIGAYALTEEQAGSDAASLQLQARLEGDHYILRGSKIFITNASQAQVIITFARAPGTTGADGIHCFIVEAPTKGLEVSKPLPKMGLHGSETCQLYFDDVKVPKENVLGSPGEGFKIAMALLDGGRLAIAAQALGIAQAAFDYTLSYLQQRHQFGRPLSANQGIQWMIADMATELDAARLLLYRAASLKESGLPFSKEASMAKKYSTDQAMKITTDCLQLLGGYGYSQEYPLERHMRDVKATQIYEGTNQIQRIVIARQLLREASRK
ncbi:acyl-CoA dehydrogenase [Heliorestis convoluta]|uniref:Acyl-CoA dehydrogenase n=1 Tax=Heliorestis convoluta TaxID=356322 RepID=A0A5Q2MZI8_9FIRM|nr:acyl-CoA dehydrogenase [Heliorestis convoluta]QGG47441.1 acyl-CoA dehydrogenase [Heliorestis convoluta]